MLSLHQVSAAFGGRVLFSAVDLNIQAKDRIGLVGPNGAGKTTLLSILEGQRAADAGSVDRRNGVRIGMLAQEAPCQIDRTVIDEATSGVGPLPDVRNELAEVTEQLAALPAADTRLDALIHRRDELNDEYERLGGERTEAEAKRILAGLGFADTDFLRGTQELSGGWRVRLALARLLVMAPDILLLDEPTNHLDLSAVEWLEGELAVYRGGLIVVSHDRSFLDAVANEIVEVEGGRVTVYTGNYSAYVKERERRRKSAESSAKRREVELAKQRQFIQRFGAQAAWASQVKSREKMLAKLEKEAADEAAAAPVRRKPVTFRFPPATHSGRVVCEVQNVSKRYDDHLIIAPLSFLIERGERISMVGPNGSGKSTLLRLLAGEEQPESGTISLGLQVRVAYFAQHQADVLDPNRTVLEEAASDAPAGTPNEKVREALGRMLFKNDMMTGQVGTLSGGERARLALAKMLLIPANLLLLDEPTNHLDIPSKEALETALSGFEGAIVVASHDRYFLERLETNKLLVMEAPGEPAVVRLGSYDDWLDLQARADAAERQLDEEETARQQAEEVRQQELERDIARLEARREAISQQLADPTAFKVDGAWGDLLEEYQGIDARLSSLLGRRKNGSAAAIIAPLPEPEAELVGARE
jgi:ATP-binding cassette subfamily F protein 3